MATNEAFSAAINARLDAAFARYPAATALTELRQEIAGNLLAAAQDLAASGATSEAAVAQAWQEFGDIAGLIADVAKDAGVTKRSHADSTTPQAVAAKAAAAQAKATAAKAKAEAARAKAEAAARRREAGTADTMTITTGKSTTTIDVSDTGNHRVIINGDLTGLNVTGKLPEASTEAPAHELRRELTGINKLRLDYASDDVTLVSTTGTELIVRETFINGRPDYAGSLTVDGDTVVVKAGKRPKSFLRLAIGGKRMGFWSTIEVAVPAQFAGSLQASVTSGTLVAKDLQQQVALTLSTQDGSLTGTNLVVPAFTGSTQDGRVSLTSSDIDAVAVTTADGSVRLQEVRSQRLTAHSGDGRVTLDQVRVAGELRATSDDGPLSLTTVSAAALTAATSDGRITASDLSGAGSLRSADGSIDAAWAAVTGDLAAVTSSGRIRLQLPATLGYAFALSTGDGHLHGPQAATLSRDSAHHQAGNVGTPAYTVTAKTGDGSVTLN